MLFEKKKEDILLFYRVLYECFTNKYAGSHESETGA